MFKQQNEALANDLLHQKSSVTQVDEIASHIKNSLWSTFISEMARKVQSKYRWLKRPSNTDTDPL